MIYNLNDLHQVIVTACSENNGSGTCYPLYGFKGSGAVGNLVVDKTSWDSSKNGYIRFNAGKNNQLMVDTSHQFYKSLFIVLNNNTTYPGICWINTDSVQNLSNSSQINITWPDKGEPQPCQIN